MSPTVYPIQWLDTTFHSRAKTEQLLRPELEAGLVSEHDFNLASSFLPGYHRYWPTAYGFLAGTFAVSLARYSRRWTLTNNRLLFISTAAGMVGALYGQVKRSQAHLRFTNQLENPSGFIQALENVNTRTGGDKPLGWSIPRAHRIPPEQQENENESESENVSAGGGRSSDERWTPNNESPVDEAPVIVSQVTKQTPPSTQEPSSSSRPPTRWEEIRVANARGTAKTSSWDLLRQTHERDRVSESFSSGQIRTPNPHDEERTKEQAKFDALLEAERKMSRG